MKTVFKSMVIAATILTAGMAQADITGNWRTEARDGVAFDVKIAACGAALCGHITGVHGGDASLVGTQLIKGMTGSDSAGYAGGEAYSPSTGRWYQSKIERAGKNIEVTGCVAGGLVCLTQTWMPK